MTITNRKVQSAGVCTDDELMLDCLVDMLENVQTKITVSNSAEQLTQLNMHSRVIQMVMEKHLHLGQF